MLYEILKGIRHAYDHIALIMIFFSSGVLVYFFLSSLFNIQTNLRMIFIELKMLNIILESFRSKL